MDQEDKRIFLLGQIALFNATIAGMVAENSYRHSCGHTPAYDEEAFQKVIQEYEGVIGHNAVIEYLRG